MSLSPYMNPDREAVLWVTAQELGTFSLGQLMAAVGNCDDLNVRNIIRSWEKLGMVQKRAGGKTLPKFLYDTRQDRTEDLIKGKSGQENMWRAARLLGSFSPAILAMHAATDETPVTEREALNYCRLLLRGGFVRVAQTAIPGKRSPIYRIILNTGPEHPREYRVRAIWDPNTGRFAHVAEPSR